MKLLITGCARSGTTLMTHLMRYFYNCRVIIDKEVHPSDYNDYNHKDHVLVIKKPAVTRFSLDYVNILSPSISRDWMIIWMVRDGRDVIVSKHNNNNYHVRDSRWVDTNEDALFFLAHPNILLVRYEKLVNDPESQMTAIKHFIGQSHQDNFREFYHDMNTEDPMNVGIKPREIDSSSVGNWKKKEHRPVVEQAMKNPNFIKLLNIFNYD